jgi:uncharacterized protein (TIGR00290 family)
MMAVPVIVAWSGGKDSLMALWKLPPDYQPAALITNVNRDQNRVSVHGIRRELLERQADALGLPLHVVELPGKPSNADYEACIEAGFAPFREQGITRVVYGDLFLEDIRRYRDDHLTRMGLQGLYPLWGMDTGTLIDEFISAGFKAVITCTDTTQVDARFAGRTIDHDLLNDLPQHADPCGENGEFHSFVYDGPLFQSEVRFNLGDNFWLDDRFCYIDLDETDF